MSLLDPFLKDKCLQYLLQELPKHSSWIIEGLWDTPKALIALLCKHAWQRDVLILSSSRESRIQDALSYFQGEPPIDFLPPEDHVDITGRRLQILHTLAHKHSPLTLFCPVQSLLQKLPSPRTLLDSCRHIKAGDQFSWEEFPQFLSNLGYIRTPLTSDKGEFSIRGGLVDIFPISAKQPYRLDFLGDTLENMRLFDPSTQRSTGKIEELFLSPTSEQILLQKETKPVSLFSYMRDACILIDNPLAIEDHFVEHKSMLSKTHLLSLQEFLQELPRHLHLFFLQEQAEMLSEVHLTKPQGRSYYTHTSPLQPLTFSLHTTSFSSVRWNHPFHKQQDVDAHPLHLIVVSSNAAEEQKLQEELPTWPLNLQDAPTFLRGYLPSGFFLPSSHLLCLSSAEYMHSYKLRRTPWRHVQHATAHEFHELTPGDFVVHLHHGIGTFLGIDHKKNHQGQETEFLKIAYAKGSQLYVPVSQSHLINRYIGAHEERPTLSTLGSSRWHTTYVKAQQSIIGYAKDLLDQMAKREISGGFCFPKDSSLTQLFDESFPFVETEDQKKALTDIKQDMCSTAPMDRLLCGDVGYGKTEIAMRAAFKAIADGGKQVLFLVPTTILALQHYETCKKRMTEFPVRIACLTRFSSLKQCKEILRGMQEGSIDLLIGTHRMVQRHLTCKDLGLLIIDEEQRFGVRTKEFIKKYKVGVDCLTLSATPIPRTLYLSLIGIRSISEISTPPQDRLPIQSFLVGRNKETIKQALLREFSRNGQAFFIHNRIETLPRVFSELQQLIPQAKIITIHGQMDADEIDTLFQCFKQGDVDLLLSTTLVENGIDIPNANTIFIDNADHFGMADLYQLRGRVGRWNRPAYAYFLLASPDTLSDLPRKRLQALVQNSGYGSGLKIALRDLELRGAGNILGEQQSGHVSSIGFHLYCKLLKKAIESLKKKTSIQEVDTKLELVSTPVESKIPETFISEPSLRMELYYRLGNSSSSQEVHDILTEIEDRFGPLPQELLFLGMWTRIRIEASLKGITLVKVDTRTCHIEKGKMACSFPLPKYKKESSYFETAFITLLQTLPI